MESLGIATSRGFHRPGMDVMATAVTWKVRWVPGTFYSTFFRRSKKSTSHLQFSFFY